MMNYTKLHEVDWSQMQRDVKEEVERIGYTYIADRPLTTHPADWYLRVVLGYNGRGFATWEYNAETKSLFRGNYDMEQHIASSDFLNRS